MITVYRHRISAKQVTVKRVMQQAYEYNVEIINVEVIRKKL